MKALKNFYAPKLKGGRSVYYAEGDLVDPELIGDENKQRLIDKGYIQETEKKEVKKKPAAKKKGKPAGAKK